MEIGGKEAQALVDTGASHNFMELKEARRLGIPFGDGMDEGTLSLQRSTDKDVKMRIDNWEGLVDFTIVSMDDYTVVLGMEFIYKAKVVPIAFAHCMIILDGDGACVVPLHRGAPSSTKTLSAMQLAKGVQKADSTFLAVLKQDDRENSLDL